MKSKVKIIFERTDKKARVNLCEKTGDIQSRDIM